VRSPKSKFSGRRFDNFNQQIDNRYLLIKKLLIELLINEDYQFIDSHPAKSQFLRFDNYRFYFHKLHEKLL